MSLSVKRISQLLAKRYNCQYCGALFARKNQCLRHEGYCASNIKRMSERYNCQFCGLLFTTKNNCGRHERGCVSNAARSTGELCPNCQNCFREDYLKKHVQICFTGKIENPRRRKTPCLVENCDVTFFHKSSILSHIRASHSDIEVKDVIEKKFQTFEEFLEWKKSEEESTYSFFCKKTGIKNKKYQHFYCQRDGSAKDHSKRKTDRRNIKGRVKVGDFCIAKMKVWKDENDLIHLQYFPTHSHKCSPEDMIHHPLPKSTSTVIKEHFSGDVSPKDILKNISRTPDLKTRINVKNGKLNLFYRRKMRAAGTKEKVAIRIYEEDSKAVYSLAQQMAVNGSLLIFKPSGGKVVHGPLSMNDLPESNDLFMFAIQTERQLQLLKKYGEQVVIIDFAYGTNRYRYQLITCMVVDENHRGWSVGHCITSRLNTASLMFYFRCIKSRMGKECDINYVITNDKNIIINSMNVGFSTEFRHILCLWHVLTNMKNRLKSTVGEEMYQEMLDEIQGMMKTREETLFTDLLNTFLGKYETNEKAEKFIKYFKSHYLSRLEKWTMCHRQIPHIEVNTIGHVESFHKRLKKTYLQTKANKHIHDLISALNDIEWDDHCTQLSEANKDIIFLPHDDVVERHEQGLLISDDKICNVFENIWEMTSTTDKSERYVIVKHGSVCTRESCLSSCPNLECHKLCCHMYMCNCPDRHPICKHIHKLHLYLSRDEPDIYLNDTEFFDLLENPCHSIVEVIIDGEVSFEDKLNSIISRIKSNCCVINESLASVDTFLSYSENKQKINDKLLVVDSVISDIASQLQRLQTNIESE